MPAGQSRGHALLRELRGAARPDVAGGGSPGRPNRDDRDDHDRAPDGDGLRRPVPGDRGAGQGRDGRVYKIYDEKTREKIALKLLKPEIAADKEAIERFGNELRFARKISHRNVCRMYDLGEEKGTHFITMEYVSGEDLKSIIRMMGPMSAGKTLHIARQVSEGLAEAHRLGVYHRDLKPQNIMIDREGNVRIMDFGIARSAKVKGLTGAGVVVGTPEYMAPEQFEGKEADARSDIYALGVILYEMTTGRLPFEGDTFVSIALKQKTEAPRTPKDFNPQLPDDLSRLILRCLERDREKRFQRVDDILADLAKIEKGVPTTERVLPSIPSTSRQITVSFNPRKLVIPAVAVLIVAAAIIVILGIGPGKKIVPRASGKPTIAIVNFENKTGDKDLDKWSTGIRDLLITDLAQSKFLDVLSDSDVYGILKKFNLADTSTYSTDDLVRIADAGGAQYTVNGSYLKAGDQIIINATCQKPHSREVISPIRLTCRGFEEITARIDKITQKIKSDLNLSQAQIAGDIDKNLGEISTPNAEAWAFYVEARRYHFRAEPEKAIPLLQKALSLDPEFVMAIRALESAYSNIGDWPESRKYAARTLELIEKHPKRVSERDRLFIEQGYYGWNKPEPEWGKSLDAGRKLLALYPDDPMSNYYMAIVYDSIEDWDEALKYFEKSVSGRSRFVSTYSSMANAFQAKGESAKAQEVLEKYLREVENTAVGHQDLAYVHLSRNRLDLAARELETAETLDPSDWGNRSLRGDILLLKGDLVGAEAEYRALLGEKLPMARYYGYLGLFDLLPLEGRYEELKKIMSPLVEQSRSVGAGEAEWNGRFAVAYSSWQSGRPVVAVDECQRAYGVNGGRQDSDYKRQTLHLKGFAYLGLNRIAEAEKTAGELKALIDKGLNRKAIRLYDHLTGAVELARNNTPKALEYLERAVRLLPFGPFEKDAWFLETLASAYLRAGDLEKARAEYEKITVLTSGRLGYGDIYARSFYHLGQISEKLGDKARARENFRKFLDLWKNADADLPEPAEAKKRLAGLS
ncbi:MAG: protein kinase [Candidatus Aminicenantes bacterium]|nr:protein kinase [Candidatus Aminicenantes bacterium]